MGLQSRIYWAVFPFLVDFDMFSKKHYSVLILGLLVFASCKKLLIKPDPTSEPERNFEIFWNDLHNGYPYFQEDGIDWKSRYDKFRNMVGSTTTTDQLYSVITQMLSGFSDGHLSVSYKKNYFSNEKGTANVFQLVRTEKSGNNGASSESIRFYYENYLAINKLYIDNSTYKVLTAPNVVNPTQTDTIFIYGKIAGNDILYVNILSFLTSASVENMIRTAITTYPSVKGMILDLRMNEGGNLGVMWNAMSVFLPLGVGEITYGYNREKVGPLPENFGPELRFAVGGNNRLPKFLGSIVVLTNRFTISAAEHATMAMRQIKAFNKQIKIVGDYTFGATSFIVQRTLPCGIEYTLVNNKTWDINRNIVERTGIKPDEFVYMTETGLQKSTDEQMERAIEIIDKNQF
ncbi:MAG TPA: hypothetical protein DCR46_06645 [Cytophagales bacterium]|nr:hypothetical protein [Cytophagales bacterium]